MGKQAGAARPKEVSQAVRAGGRLPHRRPVCSGSPAFPWPLESAQERFHGQLVPCDQCALCVIGEASSPQSSVCSDSGQCLESAAC